MQYEKKLNTEYSHTISTTALKNYFCWGLDHGRRVFTLQPFYKNVLFQLIHLIHDSQQNPHWKDWLF